MLRVVGNLLMTVILTVLTQTGGIIYLLTWWLGGIFNLSFLRRYFLFIALYTVAYVMLIPFLAHLGGRVPLPRNGALRPANLLTCLMNRHYVREDLSVLLVNVAGEFEREYGGSIHYLDACFPFYDGFPLFPHLSHSDGRKVDLAFSYNKENSGEITDKLPSWMGYGVYDHALEEEVNYAKLCTQQGFWHYDLLRGLVYQRRGYVVDGNRTAWIITQIIKRTHQVKIFLEPHLKKRWGLVGIDQVRFHGCNAVRHDDHIHVQIQ